MSIDNFHTSATKVEVIRVDTATPILNSKLAALINTCIEHPQVTPFEIPFNYINLTNPESKGCHNHIFLGQSKCHFLFWWGSLGSNCLLCVLNAQQWRMHRLKGTMYTEKAVGLLVSVRLCAHTKQISGHFQQDTVQLQRGEGSLHPGNDGSWGGQPLSLAGRCQQSRVVNWELAPPL